MQYYMKMANQSNATRTSFFWSYYAEMLRLLWKLTLL